MNTREQLKEVIRRTSRDAAVLELLILLTELGEDMPWSRWKGIYLCAQKDFATRLKDYQR